MIWGQGDGSGLRAVDSAVGRIGQLACWEHYNPLARYALIADGEQIHSAMCPGSFGGHLFAEQTEASIRNHALESGSFVVNATGWLDADQQAQIMADTGSPIGPISGGSFTAIVSPLGELLGEPLVSGEGEVIADLDFALIDQRKTKMDARGHYSRPELLSLLIDHTPASYTHELMSTTTHRRRGGRPCPHLSRSQFRSTVSAYASTAQRVSTIWSTPFSPMSATNRCPSTISRGGSRAGNPTSTRCSPTSARAASCCSRSGTTADGSSKAGIHKKALRLVIGNPLIAITMLRHDVTAGLFAPVELLLTEEENGASALTYVVPSSLMVVEPNPPLLAAARELDAKLAALAAKVTAD